MNLNISTLKTWDVVLQHTVSFIWKPSTWVARCIRWCTESKWNHSGEIFIFDGDVYVLESIWGWITLTSWSEFSEELKYVSILRYKNFDANYDLKNYLIKWLKQLDKRYDYFGILKIFVFVCTGWRSNPSKNISQTKWRCSEFNAWMKDLSWWQSYIPKDFDWDIRFTRIY